MSRKNRAPTKISGLPVVSPDKRRFVTGSDELGADHNPNKVVVGVIGDGGKRMIHYKIHSIILTPFRHGRTGGLSLPSGSGLRAMLAESGPGTPEKQRETEKNPKKSPKLTFSPNK